MTDPRTAPSDIHTPTDTDTVIPKQETPPPREGSEQNDEQRNAPDAQLAGVPMEPDRSGTQSD